MDQTTTTQDNKLEKDKKIDVLKYSISRFDGYFQAVNGKIALYISLNIFMLTAVTAGGQSIIKQFPGHTNIPVILLTLTVIASAVSLFTAIKASIPFLGNITSTIFFFGYISSLVFDDYKAKIESMDMNGVTTDLTCQAHILAKGLRSKYRYLQVAGYFLLVNVVLILSISLLVITKTP